MEELINISMSSLLKLSAMQLCYLRKKKENKKVTPRQYEGIKHQEKVSISEYKEMRGCYQKDNFLIFFSFDEVIPTDKCLILKEHKMINGPYEKWYEQYSIIQTAVYHQLALMQEKKELFTAKFFQKQGYTTKYLNYEDTPLKSVLSMGEQKIINVQPNSAALIEFYLRKLKASFEYETAKKWDELYKFKDWEQLNKFIIYTVY